MSDKNSGYPFEKQMGEILQHSSVILFICDIKKNFPLLSLSESAENILGFEKSYFLNQQNGWSNRIHPDDVKDVIAGFNDVLETSGSIINEYRFKREDGSYIWLRDELMPGKNEDGKEVIYGSSIEITDRKQTELALRQNQKQYQLVIDHIKDVTYSLGKEGEVKLLNAPWEEQMGFKVEHSLGSNFSDFIYKEDRQGFKSFLGKLLKQREAAQKVLRMQPKDDNYFWAELYAECVLQKGDLVITGTIIDVTDNIARNSKEEEVTQRLEGLVDQHTQELKTEIQEREDVEDHIQQQLSYEQAISKCSNILLQSSSPKALKESLRIIRQTTKADRVYLYKNFKADDRLCMRLAVEVCADGITPNSYNQTDTLFSYSQVPWWRQQLSSNNIINANPQDLPKEEQAILFNQNVKSVLAIPIMVDNNWYGYVGFSNIREKRSWNKNEIQLLKTAANIISAHQRRKKIQKSLIEQQNYTETILESLPSIYLLVNKGMDIEQWNNNAIKTTGYSEKEINELKFPDLISQRDRNKLGPTFSKIRESYSEGKELGLLTKADEAIPYSWHGHYITLDGENYYLLVGIDITAQKGVQAELTDEKQFNETLLQSLPGTFYMFDEEGNYLRWNQNLVDNLGYSAKDLQKLNPMEFFAEKDHEKAQEAIETVFEEGHVSIELECVTKDGKTIPYLFTGKLFKKDGENYLLGVGLDISEQVEVRRERRRNEELFRNLFFKAPAAITMVNPENNIQSVNNKFEQLFGYEENEILGKDINELLVSEEQMPFASKEPGAHSKMEEFHEHSQRVTKEGELLDVLTGIIPVYIDEEPIAYFGMYINISQQKEYEQRLQQSLEEKKTLLQEIHHRIKNNLAVVTGLIQLQLYETENEQVKATLEESESRIQTMALIHEKLYNSRSLAGVSCKSYVNGLLDTISATNESEKAISVVTDIDDIHLSTKQAVPFALLINEIVTNAYKYAFADQKSGEIKIDITKKEKVLHATICDNGIGLPENINAENTQSLGMTLVQNFMQQLEAEGEFNSDEGTCLELAFEVKPVTSSGDAVQI